MTSAHIRLVFFTVVVLGGFIIKAPLATAHVHLTPDAIVYMNIAKNLASGQGYVSTIKLHHFDKAGVTHGALSDCPPLYPLLAAIVVRLGGDVETLTLINILLVCVASGLVFLIGERLFDWRAGLIAGMAAALAPNLFRAGITAMSDPLALVLALGALSLVLKRKPSVSAWLTAGVLTALAIVTRCPYSLLALALAVFACSGPSGRRNGVAYAAGMLPAIVYMIAAMPSVQTLHYHIESFHTAMWNTGTPIDPWFCAHHPGFVAISLARSLVIYGLDLLVGLRGLFLLGLGLVAWLIQANRIVLTREQKLTIAAAGLNLAFYAATWSLSPVRGSRFMLFSYCLLLPFCAAGLLYAWDRWQKIGRAGAITVCGATACVYMLGCAATMSYKTPNDCQPLSTRKIALVRLTLEPGMVIATNNPWELSYSTGLPTALLLRNLDEPALTSLIQRYNIGGVVLLGRCKSSRTARSIAASYSKDNCGPGIAIYKTTAKTRTRVD